MSDLAVVDKGRGMPPVVPDEVIASYLESFGNKLQPFHRKQFIQICKAFQLNPFIREIYGIPYGDKFSIIVGYEVFLKRAERSGLLAGWKAWTTGEGKEMKGHVEIQRKDWTTPFSHEVYFSEYDQGNQMWKSKPATMIKKVAIAQGFRMAFPEELGGLPYTAEEVNPAEITEDVATNGTATKPAVAPPQSKAQATDKPITEGQVKMLKAKLGSAKISEDVFCAFYQIGTLELLPFAKMNEALKVIAAGGIKPVESGDAPPPPDDLDRPFSEAEYA